MVNVGVVAEILHQNNDVLRNQHQTLVNMREKQEQEKNIIQQKFSEAKDVVLALREEVQNKSRLLDELQRNIKDQVMLNFQWLVPYV